jgi:hypothetical protein
MKLILRIIFIAAIIIEIRQRRSLHLKIHRLQIFNINFVNVNGMNIKAWDFAPCRMIKLLNIEGKYCLLKERLLTSLLHT